MYDKQDAVMTQGFAILCMVILHLFCRTGPDVFGTPLLWIDRDTPFVYWFGFYAEICVSVFSVCAGYAQYLLYLNGRTTWRSTGKRILKLLVNYWTILLLFSVLGLIHSSQKTIPGSLPDFLKSIFLLHSYNGAWWYLNTYLLFLLIPAAVKFFPVKKLSVSSGLVLCFVFSFAWYLINKFGYWPSISESNRFLSFILKELHNLIGILPSVLAGAFLCKGNVITRVNDLILKKVHGLMIHKLILGSAWIVLFVAMNLIHKAALTIIFSLASFLLFNLWEKGQIVRKIWLFLGKHSTNIWLTHMFFYSVLFPGLVQKAKYPIVMLGFMLILCIFFSYLEKMLEKGVYRAFQHKPFNTTN